MTRFRYNCSERGACWLDVRWDSHALGQAASDEDGQWPFPRGITPSDIDGFIECAGHCLFIETKSAGAPMPNGQRRALAALSAQGATVLVQECDPPHEDAVTRTQLCYQGKWRDWEQSDRLIRDRLVQRWFEWAQASAHAQAA